MTLRATVLGLVCGAWCVPLAQAMDAHDWWQAMNEALMHQTYHAMVLHQSKGRFERLQLWHRLKDGQVDEHLLSARGREIVCSRGEMRVIVPQAHSVTIHDFHSASVLRSVPEEPLHVSDYYQVELSGEAPLMYGRPSVVLWIRPKDGYRFGYRFTIDVESHLPLRSEVVNAVGQVEEQWLFEELQVGAAVSDAGFHAATDVSGFSEVRANTSESAPATKVAFKSIAHLPPGFEVKQWVTGADGVMRLSISDGLAMLSVFIEATAGGPFIQQHGEGQLGTARVVSDQWQGHKLTVVGEVPRETVHAVAAAMHETLSGSSAGGEGMP